MGLLEADYLDLNPSFVTHQLLELGWTHDLTSVYFYFLIYRMVVMVIKVTCHNIILNFEQLILHLE